MRTPGSTSVRATQPPAAACGARRRADRADRAGRPAQSGVSLLEALVALLVMTVGAVSVVALQTTLRQNADVAKQRTEALRFATDLMEQWRGYVTLAATADKVDWVDIVSGNATLTGSNADFTREVTVQPGGAGDDPRSKRVHVSVGWTDRTGAAQTLALNTLLTAVPPELGGSLALPADQSLLRNPVGRHASIPRGAVDQSDGTSHFTPPGAGTNYWVYNNATGLIVDLCTSPGVCLGIKAVPILGFVRFATGTTQPTPAQAESPVEAPIGGVLVEVDQDLPINQFVACYHELGATYIAYFCAVPIDITDSTWSGKVQVIGLPALATSIADANASAYRVCRYTLVRDNTKVVPTDLKNEDRPLYYVSAGAPLVDQNFLVIRAGFGGVAFACPDDDSATPHVSGATWHHQPSI